MASGRFVPTPDQDTVEFWHAAKRHELVVQHCDDCGNDQLYPRLLCMRCHGRRLGYRLASGKGTVYSKTIVRRAPSPALRDEVPYAIVLVELDEGPRLMANVVECAVEDLSIGMQVEVVFEDVSDSVSLPFFRPTLV